jgi:menaquinone-dependent protoporphyrinogen oxidase
MSRVLLVYGTTEGHTARIAATIAEALAAAGHQTTALRAGDPLPALPEDAAGVIVGASVHLEHHQPEVVEFVRRNLARLNELPSAFFQVCLAAADDTAEAETEVQGLLDRFVEETGWDPRLHATFAGRLAWTEYDPFTRIVMRLLLRQKGLPPEELDPSHDVDYTDYDAVRRFAQEFAQRLGPA